jgi:cobalt-zinc-cadmium efflux system outer membrane protein
VKPIIPVCLIFCSLTPLFGQQQSSTMSSRSSPMTLEQIEAVAMVGNPEIRAAVRRVSLAETRVSGAGALDDPMFMYRDWGTPLKRPYDLNQAQNMFMLQQTFPGPGKRAARSEVAAREVSVAKEQLEGIRRDVQVRVRKAFYDLMRNADELRIHDEQMRLTRQAVESARIKYTAGRVPQQDVLKAQIAMTKVHEHLIMLQEQGEMSCATLNTLMGREPSISLQIAGQYSTNVQVPTLAKLEEIAIEHRPELRAYAAQQKVAQARANLAGKAYTPDFTVGLGYMLMPEGSMSRNNYMAEVSMNLPWLNRRKHDAEIAEANVMTQNTKAEYDIQRAAVSLEIQETLIKVRSAQRTLELYRDTLRPQAEATFRAAAAAYQHDRTDFLNLIDSQNMMLDVQSSFYRTAAQLDSRVADLERAIGTAVPRENTKSDGVQQ